MKRYVTILLFLSMACSMNGGNVPAYIRQKQQKETEKKEQTQEQKRRRRHRISVSGKSLADALMARDRADDSLRAEQAAKAREQAEMQAVSDRLEKFKAKREADAAAAAERHTVLTLTFPKGSAFLNEDSRSQISYVALLLKGYPEAVAVIDGYAFNDGPDGSVDIEIAKKRAGIIKEFLLANDIEDCRIIINACGIPEPLSEDPAANRVAVITIK